MIMTTQEKIINTDAFPVIKITNTDITGNIQKDYRLVAESEVQCVALLTELSELDAKKHMNYIRLAFEQGLDFINLN